MKAKIRTGDQVEVISGVYAGQRGKVLRVYPEKLAGQLQQQLHSVYLISGDETLLVQECADAVRSAARQQGCTDRQVIDAGVSNFDWDEILQHATSMSLFAERKLVEIRLPSGKPGTEGSKSLCEYLELAGGEDVLMLIAGKIDKQSTNSKWYKALDKAGATVQVWPVTANDLPRWLQQRVTNAGMTIERWYHRAAVVIWPRERHFDVLCGAGTDAAIGISKAQMVGHIVVQWVLGAQDVQVKRFQIEKLSPVI
mgnify:CR=1 FL=1